MIKKTIAAILVSVGLSTQAIASDSLKMEMNELAGSVSTLQVGFFTNDKKATLEAVSTLRKQVKEYIGDVEQITKLLPKDVQHKSSIAINSAEMIEKYAKEIKRALEDKNMRMINRQMKTQKAFLEIQNQCFRCHNLVRDWQ